MRFPYPRMHFIIRFLVMISMLAGIIYLLSVPGADTTWLDGFGLLGVATIILVALSPAFTAHEINEEAIILRQGMLFKGVFPFFEIASVSRTETKLWAFWLFPAGGRGRVVLANGRLNLVSVKLRERKRFGMLLWRSADEIIIDLESPEEFVRVANEKLLR